MITMDKKYRTRGNLDAVIYCNDAPGDYPVHGRINEFYGGLPTTWRADGKHCAEARFDLIEVQPERWQAYEWVARLFMQEDKGRHNLEQMTWQMYPSEAAARAAHPDAAVIVKVPG